VIGKTNVGGGGATADAFAYVHVDYTVGAVCTATNGSVTFTAPNTSGSVVFAIPEPSSLPETWTIAVTNGTLNRTTSVSITAQYQFEDITMYLSRLPEGYQEVEYLESVETTVGTSTRYGYIQLGSIAASATADENAGEINLAFMLLSTHTHLYRVFGAYNGGIFNTAEGAQNVAYVYGGEAIGWSNATMNTKMNVTINQIGTRAIIENGVTIGTCSGTLSGNINAFAVRQNGGNDGVNTYGMRIYEITLSNNSGTALKRDFVPCVRISDSTPGYYELVGGTFHSSALMNGGGIAAGGYV